MNSPRYSHLFITTNTCNPEKEEKNLNKTGKHIPMVMSSHKDPHPSRVGILTFETASTMSTLVSLHHTLSDPLISKLRSDIMRSQGVAYLNSTDQSVLIKQCCAELITDLDRAADFISRLSHRCQSAFPIGFDRIYSDLKSGSIDPTRLGIKPTAKSQSKTFRNLQKHIQTVSKLYSEMEILSELEANENKKFGRFSGPILVQKPNNSIAHTDMKSQAQKVSKLKEESLWNQGFDKAIGLMALACYSIFVRICIAFSPFVAGLPRIVVDKERSRLFFSTTKMRIGLRTGPLDYREIPRGGSCPIIKSGKESEVVNWHGELEAGGSTVGGSGLAMRYGSVIVMAEKVMIEGGIGEAEREELYGMIPEELGIAVRGKLRRIWRERGGEEDRELAGGWKEAVWRIMDWLGPVAHDTVNWEVERSAERRKKFEVRERTYLMQTLHFADRVKTEAAIVEVLVGLSMVCWYDERFRR